MTTKRLAVLLLVLVVGFSSVFAIPRRVGVQAAGIRLALPERIGDWEGREMGVTEKERETLGHETEFARKSYSNLFGDNIHASIVLSGEDMMQSIHRPERCLDAQGWTFGTPERRWVKVPNVGRFEVMRVHKWKLLQNADGTPLLGQDGKPIRAENTSYYWFAGSKDLTPSHMERVWIDSRDRLMNGEVQRWAMIMVTAEITAKRHKFGRDEKATDQLLEDFIARVVPHVHLPTLQYES
jgi:hypothetical protein